MNRGFRRYKKVPADSAKQVDLGLSNFLNSFLKDDASENNSIEAESQSQAAEAAEVQSVESLPLNEYENLAVAEKWRELCSLSESRFSNEQSAAPNVLDFEARIWWLKGQLGIGGVPISILAAPLDSVTKGLIDFMQTEEQAALVEKSLKRIAAQVLMQVAAVVDEESGLALSAEFRARASKIFPEISTEMSNKKTSGESKASALGKKSRDEKSAPLVEAGVFPVSLDSSTSDIIDRASELEGKRSAPWRLALLIVMLFLVGYAFSRYWYAGQEESDVINRGLSLSTENPKADTVAPEIERVASMSGLDAVFYDLQHAPSGLKPKEAEGNVPAADNVAKENPAAKEAHNAGLPKVDTSGPKEPAELTRIMEGAGNERSVGENRPAEDGSSIAAANRKAEPQRVVSTPKFEDFGRPRVFEIIAPTSVMRQPSIRGEVLADLKDGDKIMVEGTEGYWLKVRSRKSGKLGYVLSQDASPEKNW